MDTSKKLSTGKRSESTKPRLTIIARRDSPSTGQLVRDNSQPSTFSMTSRALGPTSGGRWQKKFTFQGTRGPLAKFGNFQLEPGWRSASRTEEIRDPPLRATAIASSDNAGSSMGANDREVDSKQILKKWPPDPPRRRAEQAATTHVRGLRHGVGSWPL